MESDLLFGWFVGLGPDEPTRDASTFSKNRDRLLNGDIAAKFLNADLSRRRTAAGFGERFRDFLNAGGYEAREQSSGHREFYRFHKPKDKDFPFMVEFFSKEPDRIPLPEDTVIVRFEVEADIVSLSAILLEPKYFEALQNGKRVENGVTVLDQPILIPFKARTFLDLMRRRNKGATIVKGDEIRKHRADVFRLSRLLPGNAGVQVSEPLRDDTMIGSVAPALSRARHRSRPSPSSRNDLPWRSGHSTMKSFSSAISHQL